ncbi:MAG TPA: S41 family peptidase [Candidatus Udaeobacter sp.]|nr:S41 family peptidase [Candidatus Udaeobacter sp.]
MSFRVALRGGAVVLVVALAFIAGVYVDQAYPDYVPYLAHHNVGKVDLSEAEQVARLIAADYVDTNVDPTKLAQGSAQGMVQSLGDPFTSYFTPDQYRRLQESYQGRYTGIGVYLSFSTGYPVITGTLANSPAAAAGIKAGDQIVRVGDKDVKGITVDQASTLIEGPSGTKVTITISRGDQQMTLTLTRAEIQVPSVQSTLLPNRILYVRIYQFGSQTSADLSSALKSGVPGASGIVLDLRGNPGGFTSAADDTISQFVTSGETFETHGRSGVDKHQVGSTHLAPTQPLVVLVDANSASSAEIVSGSLQVHSRAKLVGTKTFGKGSVQQDFVLTDGADIHMTVERWFLPNGQTIDHKGLTPDIAVTLANPADMFDVQQPALGYAEDTQLITALTLLSGG